MLHIVNYRSQVVLEHVQTGWTYTNIIKHRINTPTEHTNANKSLSWAVNSCQLLIDRQLSLQTRFLAFVRSPDQPFLGIAEGLPKKKHIPHYFPMYSPNNGGLSIGKIENTLNKPRLPATTQPRTGLRAGCCPQCWAGTWTTHRHRSSSCLLLAEYQAIFDSLDHENCT